MKLPLPDARPRPRPARARPGCAGAACRRQHVYAGQAGAGVPCQATADNSTQIEPAKVARDRSSSSPQVREPASRIIEDHESLNRKFTDFSVARKATGQSHGTPPEDVPEDKLRLQQLQGEALDQAFAGMMVAEHQKIIPLYERAAKDSHDPKLRQIAGEGLPMLRDHLQRAHAITTK